MSKSIITVENLGKKYSIGEKQNFYTLRDSLAGMFNNKKKTEEEFWALKDVNFEIKQGESVGIIGRNGAGKSTLLKILSQITPPTTGKITMRGRVASLLEVGTGFHQELTGRENIFLNGAILGMTREEVRRKFDEIVAFSEVEKFLDMPVKHYSSGMYMRLAFAVAAHLESEILIVDEVLAVGDAQFQKKCLGKMDEVAKKQGRTVLFVSHNMGAVESICKNGILLTGGKIVAQGNVSKVVDEYSKSYKINNSFTKPTADSIIWLKSLKIIDEYMSDKVKFLSPFSIEIIIESKKELNAIVGLDFTNSIGNIVTTIHSVEIGSGDEDENSICKIKQGKNKFVVKISNNVFRPGKYQVGISIFSRKLMKNLYRSENAGFLEVTNSGNGIYFDERQQGLFFQGKVNWQN